MHAYAYIQLTFKKGVKAIQLGKDNLFFSTNCLGIVGLPQEEKKKNLDPYFTQIQKLTQNESWLKYGELNL